MEPAGVCFYESNFQDKSIYMIFHIFKLNNLKVIHDLYSHWLIQTLSKTTSNSEQEGVQDYNPYLIFEMDLMSLIISWSDNIVLQ
jgi:hypothetical protein